MPPKRKGNAPERAKSRGKTPTKRARRAEALSAPEDSVPEERNGGQHQNSPATTAANNITVAGGAAEAISTGNSFPSTATPVISERERRRLRHNELSRQSRQRTRERQRLAREAAALEAQQEAVTEMDETSTNGKLLVYTKPE